MASLGNLYLTNRVDEQSVGAALRIDKSPDENHRIDVDDDWEVELAESSQYAVARGTIDVDTEEEALSHGHSALQQALDILSIQNDDQLRVENADSSRIVWWESDSSQHLRVVEISDVAVSTEASATVIDEDGNEVEIESDPTEWHESLRYFRLAQNTDDLFDAYRNLFLALELILSERVPINSGERESDWLKRALRDVHSSIGVDNYADDPGNPVDSIYQSQYVGIRCEMFHAKKSKDRLLPHNEDDRKKVEEAIGDLARLVVDTIKDTMSVNRASGLMTNVGFEKTMQWMKSEQGAEVLVSTDDSPVHKSESVEHEAWKPRVSLSTEFSEKLSEPGLMAVLGQDDPEDRFDGQSIYRLGLVEKRLDSDSLVVVSPVSDGLSVDGIDVLEVGIGIQLNNVNSVRTDFPS